MHLITIRSRTHFAHSPQSPEFRRRVGLRRRGVGVGVGSTQESTYLRRWITHQAATYESLLRTIAAAPRPERPEASVSARGSRSPGRSGR